MKRWILACLWAVLLTPAARGGEGLVYSVSTGEPKPFPRLTKTEIFAVDPETDKPRLIFSDANASFLLLPAYPGSGEAQVMAASGGRIFARGFERKLYTGGWPTFPAAIYELSTDGSGLARKLFDIEGEHGSSNFRNLFVSPSGSKIGHINYLGGKAYIFLHETATGKLLREIDLSVIALDCFVSEIGWMPDSERLFFTLETGDVHVTSKASYARVGSYVMREDGGAPVRVAREAAMHPQRPGYHIQPDSPAVLLGGLPHARYLFREFQRKQGPKGRLAGPIVTFLYAVDPATRARKDFPTSAQGILTSFRLSHSGRAVAFTEVQRQNETQTVWVVDLESGKERKLFSFSTKSLALPWMNLIGWLDEK